MGLVSRNVAEINLRAPIDARLPAMVNNHVHLASYPVKSTADIPNAHESAQSRVPLVLKRIVSLHVRIVHVLCPALPHVIMSHAH